MSSKAEKQIAKIHEAINGYVDALVNRENGSTAQHIAFETICQVLGRQTTNEMDAKRKAK